MGRRETRSKKLAGLEALGTESSGFSASAEM